jgi:hypothetical protein
MSKKITQNKAALLLSFLIVGAAIASSFVFVASAPALAEGGQGGEGGKKGIGGSGGNKTASDVAPEKLKFFDRHDPEHTWNGTALSYFDSNGTELTCDKVYNGTIYYQVNDSLFKCNDFGLPIPSNEQAAVNGQDGQDGEDGQDGQDGASLTS